MDYTGRVVRRWKQNCIFVEVLAVSGNLKEFIIIIVMIIIIIIITTN
jgi:hypothetical protein